MDKMSEMIVVRDKWGNEGKCIWYAKVTADLYFDKFENTRDCETC